MIVLITISQLLQLLQYTVHSDAHVNNLQSLRSSVLTRQYSVLRIRIKLRIFNFRLLPLYANVKT